MPDTVVVRLCASEKDFAAWDRYVFDLPGAHFFQTYGWLHSYQSMGFTPHVLVCEINGVIRAGVGFLVTKLPWLPWRIFIIPHGPLPSIPSLQSWSLLMARLDEICVESRAIYAQVYPHELTENSVLLSRLHEIGFTDPPMFGSHRFSSTPVTVDLAGKSEAEVLMTFRPRTRQYIRKSLSSEFELRTTADEATFHKVYELVAQQAMQKGYSARPYASMRSTWEWFAPKGGVSLMQAWWKDTLVGAIYILYTGQTAYYLAGAFRREFSERRPAEFLHWHAILEAMKRRVATYDLVNTVSSGVEQFKRGFRPMEQSWHAPRTKVYRPFLARATRAAEKVLKPIIRTLVRYQADRS
ncbi:protein of unknown function [Nitrospira japonica]|uniref:BioF2-like acetyltransferase domain-containing protein n=1 Tax=Nitrospira japonica TaxID=1325564 RepID=A0A1W1IAE8_9BACT|nr:GNAT family N-acetyltransferase [Nitrospira japonica]SLM49965.1 protein of unknown function [Nitrospira japonica]